MAVTISLYNQTASLVMQGKLATSNTFKVMLLDSDATFNPAHTKFTDVSSDEVSGNGWTAGGETLANAGITIVTTDDAKFDADDVSVVATPAAITASAAVIGVDDGAGGYDLLAFVDFGVEQTAEAGNVFSIIWDANGIFQVQK